MDTDEHRFLASGGKPRNTRNTQKTEPGDREKFLAAKKRRRRKRFTMENMKRDPKAET
jgi:hypothetical protein